MRNTFKNLQKVLIAFFCCLMLFSAIGIRAEEVKNEKNNTEETSEITEIEEETIDNDENSEVVSEDPEQNNNLEEYNQEQDSQGSDENLEEFEMAFEEEGKLEELELEEEELSFESLDLLGTTPSIFDDINIEQDRIEVCSWLPVEGVGRKIQPGVKYSITVYYDDQDPQVYRSRVSSTEEKCSYFDDPDLITAIKQNKNIKVSELVYYEQFYDANYERRLPPKTITGSALELLDDKNRNYIADISPGGLATEATAVEINVSLLSAAIAEEYPQLYEELEIELYYLKNLDSSFFATNPRGIEIPFDANDFLTQYMSSYRYRDVTIDVIKKELENYYNDVAGESYIRPNSSSASHLWDRNTFVDIVSKYIVTFRITKDKLSEIGNSKYAMLQPPSSALLLGANVVSPWMEETSDPNIILGPVTVRGRTVARPNRDTSSQTVTDFTSINRISISLSPYNVHQLTLSSTSDAYFLEGQHREEYDYNSKLLYSSFSDYKYLYHEDVQELVEGLNEKYPFLVVSAELYERLTTNPNIKNMNKKILSLIKDYTSTYTQETLKIITIDKLVPYLVNHESLKFYTNYRNPETAVGESEFISRYQSQDKTNHLYMSSELEEFVDFYDLQEIYQNLFNVRFSPSAVLTQAPPFSSANNMGYLHNLYFEEYYDSVDVEKYWEDDDNVLGIRPDTINLNFEADTDVYDVLYPIITADLPEVFDVSLLSDAIYHDQYEKAFKNSCDVRTLANNSVYIEVEDLNNELYRNYQGIYRSLFLNPQYETAGSVISQKNCLLPYYRSSQFKNIIRILYKYMGYFNTHDSSVLDLPIIFQTYGYRTFEELNKYSFGYSMNIDFGHLDANRPSQEDPVAETMFQMGKILMTVIFNDLNNIVLYHSDYPNHETHSNIPLEGAKISLFKINMNDYISILSELYFEDAALEDVHNYIVRDLMSERAREAAKASAGSYGEVYEQAYMEVYEQVYREVYEEYGLGKLTLTDLLEYTPDVPLHILDNYQVIISEDPLEYENKYTYEDLNQMLNLLKEIYNRYYKLEKFPTIMITQSRDRLPDEFLEISDNQITEYISKLTIYNSNLQEIEFSQDESSNYSKETFKVPKYSTYEIKEEPIPAYTSEIFYHVAPVDIDSLRLWPVISSETGELVDFKFDLPILGDNILGYSVIKSPRIYAQVSLPDNVTKRTFPDLIYKIDGKDGEGNYIYTLINFDKFKEEYDNWLEEIYEAYFNRYTFRDCDGYLSDCLVNSSTHESMLDFHNRVSWNLQFDLEMITNRGELFLNQYKLHTEASVATQYAIFYNDRLPDQHQLPNMYDIMHKQEDAYLPIPYKATITNRLKRVGLTVKNQINDPGDQDKKFEYTLSVPDMPNFSVSDEITLDDSGSYTFSLSNDESITFDLVPGFHYVIQQEDYVPENYITTHENTQNLLYHVDRMFEEDVELLFEQDYPTYDLTIKKLVEGTMGNKEKEFEFNVQIIEPMEKTVAYNIGKIKKEEEIGVMSFTPALEIEEDFTIETDLGETTIPGSLLEFRPTFSSLEENYNLIKLTENSKPYKIDGSQIYKMKENGEYEPVYCNLIGDFFSDNRLIYEKFSSEEGITFINYIDHSVEENEYRGWYLVYDNLEDLLTPVLNFSTIGKSAAYTVGNEKFYATGLEVVYGNKKYPIYLKESQQDEGVLIPENSFNEIYLISSDFEGSNFETIEIANEYTGLKDLSNQGCELNEETHYFVCKMQHNESLYVSGIKPGMKISVEEKDYSSEGYVTTINGEKTNSINSKMPIGDLEILVINSNNTVIPTGVSIKNLKGILYIVIGSLAFILINKTRKKKN